MDKAIKQLVSGGIVRAFLLMAALTATGSTWGQATAVRKLAEPAVNAIKVVAGGERTDRLVIEFSGREPELAVQNVDGTLVVTLGGVTLAPSAQPNLAAVASLGVVQSVQAVTQGRSVELKIQAKVKAWTYSAMQSRRNITIEFVAAAVQPEATAALAVPAAVAISAAPSGDGAAPASEPASGRRQAIKPCIECHEGFYSIKKTKHYVRGDSRTPGAKGADQTAAECESCHGDLSAHQRTPRTKGLVPITFGKKSPAAPQNEACLACHQSGTRIHWQGSGHERSKQSCASCHRLHAPKDPVMVAETQASVCFDCHKDRRAEMHRTSTHPTKIGFITCSSCHASHGSSTRASLQKDSVNDTCYTCHADKRGPFLWEHRPVQDDCTNCHNAHGTNNPPMLKVRMPYLCQQCHQTTSPGGHAAALFSGTDAGTGSSTGALPSNARRILGSSCANCHVKVHGSNHPSGARLKR